MKQQFNGWREVASRLRQVAVSGKSQINGSATKTGQRLNRGQMASLGAIADRIQHSGVVIADEVGMGKTRIAVELAKCVTLAGGRVAILVPPGLGYQWHAELCDGGIEVPLILRSLWQFLAVWKSENELQQQPWFDSPVVVVSHAFTNWKLSEKSDQWRWALLPELYCCWRKRQTGRFPRNYKDNEHLSDTWVRTAARSICGAIPDDQSHVAWQLLDALCEQTTWPGALDGAEYGRDKNLRPWLERSVGLGLGTFDLIIIDEAHKSRGTESGLSKLLANVIQPTVSTRRLAMTATPVELDLSQWRETLSRIGLDSIQLADIKNAVDTYGESVKRVRQSPSSSEARGSYRQSAAVFQRTLSPFLLRRDKREDAAVRLFSERTGLPAHNYRSETEILVEVTGLSPAWKDAVCAAEALSLVTNLIDDSDAKRLRLTLGNGHGISTLLDQSQRDDQLDRAQNAEDDDDRQADSTTNEKGKVDTKRLARAQWWRQLTERSLNTSGDALFEHPAILAAVRSIEQVTEQREKVLVFGRFTQPLRALVDLLNARQMLRALESGIFWPQAKIPKDVGDRDWLAIEVAHRQLESTIQLESLDTILEQQYSKLENERKQFRRDLIENLTAGLAEIAVNRRVGGLFAAFVQSVAQQQADEVDQHPLALVGRALWELVGDRRQHMLPADYANSFVELIGALSVQNEGDTDGNGELDDIETIRLWDTLEARLRDEYKRPQGGFSRLMFGGTKPETRRMMQLAFNRQQSFPMVLVAQSLVGREGLNLHKACKTVVLLHPEWNPGVVEQQIGRVDRVGSLWASQLSAAVQNDQPVDLLPRISIRPVVFQGTYDEHNWKILRERWDDLRAQLHGIVINECSHVLDRDQKKYMEEITEAAPNFSPTAEYPF